MVTSAEELSSDAYFSPPSFSAVAFTNKAKRKPEATVLKTDLAAFNCHRFSQSSETRGRDFLCESYSRLNLVGHIFSAQGKTE